MEEQKELPELSKAEYDILRILWKHGNLTVREVHDQLHETYGWAYTTTKTMMDRMVNKELLDKEVFHRIYLYAPRISRPEGLAKLVQFFADRILETDANTVVAMFNRSDAITPQEIEQLEALLDDEKKMEAHE